MRHAAARSDEVLVVRRAPAAHTADELWHYRRRDGEADSAFAARIRALEAPERREPAGSAADADARAGEAAAKKRVLPALVRGGVAPQGATGEVYRLLPGPPTAGGWRR
ncbi:hypothetical protein [Streptomyces sp. NPDC052721]|uniref:hypothetical protein n=1 Tax=Streptomyces sp. NPDC052721 TaxID=3154955 RepID=UPI0034392F20